MLRWPQNSRHREGAPERNPCSRQLPPTSPRGARAGREPPARAKTLVCSKPGVWLTEYKRQANPRGAPWRLGVAGVAGSLELVATLVRNPRADEPAFNFDFSCARVPTAFWF